MRWRLGRRSTNIEDRRGGGGRGMRVPVRLPFPGRGRGGTAGRVGGLGIGGVLIIIVLSLVFGIDPMLLLGGGGGTVTVPGSGQGPPTGADDELKEFTAHILGDTEDTWQMLFEDLDGTYQVPRLVLFDGAVQSACGYQQAAVGPFYCPGDRQVYLDLGFFRELRDRFAAPGDFARAYVIAHEIGHHVQNLLEITSEVRAAQRGASQEDANALSVRLELQADCLAGVWAHHAENQRDLLEPGDLEEGLRAASAIGDDTLQRRSQGYVVPESFTHGSSEERMQWFRTGFEAGRVGVCDTFSAEAF